MPERNLSGQRGQRRSEVGREGAPGVGLRIREGRVSSASYHEWRPPPLPKAFGPRRTTPNASGVCPLSGQRARRERSTWVEAGAWDCSPGARFLRDGTHLKSSQFAFDKGDF
jgi:hypothetical protein